MDKWQFKTPPRRTLRQRQGARTATAEHYASACKKERERRQEASVGYIRPDVKAAYLRYTARKGVSV